MKANSNLGTDCVAAPEASQALADLTLAAEVVELRGRLEEAESLIHAIRCGEVDAFVIAGAEQDRVYTLQTADRSYRLFVEQMHQGAALLDGNGNVLFCNRSLAAMLGRDVSGVVGMRVDCLVDAAGRGEHEGLFEPEPEEARQAEVVFRRLDGSCVTAHVTASRLPDDASLVTLIVSDLTEQRYFERLARAERALRFALDAAVAVAFTWDIPANRFVRLQSQTPTIAPATDDRVETLESVISAIDAADRDAFVSAINAAVRGDTDYRAEFRVIGADGSRRWLSESGRMEFDASGRPLRLSGLSIDITSRKEGEENLRRAHAELEQRVAARTADLEAANRALRESEERYRTVVEDQTELVCRRRPDGTLTFANDVFWRFFGGRREALTGRCWQLAGAGAEGESLEAELTRLGPEAPVVVFANRVSNLHGKERWMEFVNRGLFAPDGSLVEIQSVGRDITERKEAEARVVRAMEKAEAATRAKGDFLANMSHEIRTPMSGVIGMADLLIGTDLDDIQIDYVETIRSSGEALLTVINDILDLSKIESGKMTLELVPFDLRTLMEEVAELLSPSARQKGLRLSCRVDAGVTRQVLGDASRIRQVLTNLVGNAVRFTERGEVTLEVQPVREANGHARLRIAVSDTGIGIARGDHDRVFESFTQVEGGSTRKYGGTGLGLTICRRLVDLMGGTIGLESELGTGSTFWFELELAGDQCPLKTDFERSATGRRAGSAEIIPPIAASTRRQLPRKSACPPTDRREFTASRVTAGARG